MSTELPVEYADIEQALMRDSHARNTVMPRFTPVHWWECDVLEITPAGYMRECEIKMSRGDFKADASKGRTDRWPEPGAKWRTKHELLAAGDPRGPSVFNFVTPAELLRVEEIPVWAGLIEIHRRADVSYPFARVLKIAPRLHKQKAPDAIKRRMLGSAYGRLHGAWWDEYYRTLCNRAG